MEKLKLLFITRDYSKSVDLGHLYLSEELAKITDLTLWHTSGNIHTILKRLKIKPDFILINEYGERRKPVIKGLSTLKIPYGIYMHDLQHTIKERKKSMHSDRVQYIFSIYRDKFYHWFPEKKNKMVWFPYHINPNVFKDYDLPKDIDMLVIGAVSKLEYPLRYKIIEIMRNRSDFVYHSHPGYRDMKEPQKFYFGEKYAREINRAKIFFTCQSIYTYPVRKYYEVLASNTLLLAPSSQELTDLGFIPGVHYVEINEHDFKQKAEYYLKNEEERLKIAMQGYQMVHQNHTTAIRARQLVTKIEEILADHKPNTINKFLRDKGRMKGRGKPSVVRNRTKKKQIHHY